MTVVHADYSPATVPTARATRIELGPRGSIRGILVDESGAPIARTPLRLDADPSRAAVTTSEVGRFAFEGVEAGAHGVFAESGELLAAVRVGVGEDVELELDRCTSGQLEIENADALDMTQASGLLVGRGRVSSLCALSGHGAADGAQLVARQRVLPGRYWLVTDSGLGAQVVVEAGAVRSRAQAGAAALLVRSPFSTNVQVVPADADGFLRLAAARLRVPIQENAERRFLLEPGSYVVVGEAGRTLAEVEVPSRGALLELEAP